MTPAERDLSELYDVLKRLGALSMKARLYLACGGADAYRELASAVNRELDYLTPLPTELSK